MTLLGLAKLELFATKTLLPTRWNFLKEMLATWNLNLWQSQYCWLLTKEVKSKDNWWIPFIITLLQAWPYVPHTVIAYAIHCRELLWDKQNDCSTANVEWALSRRITSPPFLSFQLRNLWTVWTGVGGLGASPCTRMPSASREKTTAAWVLYICACSIFNKIQQSDDSSWVQFVLDCSVIPEVISAAQKDKSVYTLLFKATRTWCYSLHRTRLKLSWQLAI